jgi:cytochrome P450
MAIVYDPMSPGFHADRVGVYRRMRDEAPVFFDPDGRFVALTRYDDVRAAGLDWQTFSSITAESAVLRPIISSMDPPLHTNRRGNLARAFTPRRVAELEPRLRARARSLVAAFAERGTCDLVADFAALFPSMVMAELLGLPDEVLAECRSITDDIMRIRTPEENRSPVQRADAVFLPLIEARRSEPQDDLISALLAVGEEGGEPLSEPELLGFCFLLLVGGNDTTVNLLGNGMDLLDLHPDQRALLVGDPSRMTAAVEEIMRFGAPTQNSWRQTTREVTLHGVTIPADRRVLLVWGAANLDERVFPDADRFAIARAPHPHLTLGHGPHFCMGAALARLEARVAFEELLAVMPEFAVTERGPRIPSSWAWGYESLHVEFPVR